MRRRLSIAIILVALATGGCFDLETEIRILPDGSGFLTGWVRMDRRDAILATAVGGRGLAAETASAASALAEAAGAADGVDLIDHSFYEEADRAVFRYRLVFDNPKALNDFLNGDAAREMPLLPAAAKLEMTGARCGDFSVHLNLAQRDPRKMVEPDPTALSNLDAATFDLLVEKMFSGSMRLRVAPPGKVRSSNAPMTDAQGLPVYEKRLHGVLTSGLYAQVESALDCETMTPGVEPAEGVTVGPAATADEVVRVMRSLPHFAQAHLVLTQTDAKHARWGVRVDAKSATKEAVEFYLPLIFALFPGAATQMEWTAAKAAGDTYRYEFFAKEPLDFSKFANPFVYVGKDGGKNVFRMRLPKFPHISTLPPDAPSHRVLSVEVTLVDPILQTNADTHEENKAAWRITDQMLREPIVLEAITE
ncbi:hypothetical protein K8I61_15260 [bacterium]|nr:hypothetical protein [bacterium]